MAAFEKFQTILFWLARIWGGLSILFLIYFLGAHLTDAINGGEPVFNFKSANELIGFVFFPVSTLIGLLWSYKHPGTGGLITVFSILGFFIAIPDMVLNPLITGLAMPGLLFLIYWILSKKIGKKERNDS